MKEITPTIIRSSRKSIAIQLDQDGNVIVRAPYGVSNARIMRFVQEKESWIRRHQEQIAAQNKEAGTDRLSPADIQSLADQALGLIPERVAFYAGKLGVTYGRITIRNQKTKWGSCSSRGNLNFNCLLMLTPPEVIDSVVVHELCHRKEMNHSQAFYQEILRVYPEYHKWNQWLKKNGAAIMKRVY